MKTKAQNIFDQLEERLDLLDGNLTVGNPTDENLAELTSIVRVILAQLKSNERVLCDHLKDVV